MKTFKTLLHEYQNGNYTVKIFDDGTKIKETNDDEFIADFPESIDLKITNYCDLGCSYCHENSTTDGEHGDITLPFLKTLRKGTEVACLSGDTYVYNNNGAIKIKDLSVGDYIFDSTNTLRKVINISKSNKDSFLLKGDKGFKVVCSLDHPFMIDGKQIIAKDTIGKHFDRLLPQQDEIESEYIIDMGKYISHRNDKLIGSRGGKIFENDTVRLRGSNPIIPRCIKLNEDLMYLYGLFVAEGSSRGLTLNINKLEIFDYIQNIWNNTFNCDCKVYLHHGKSSFDLYLNPATLIDSFFVKAMKVGKGARNKSLSKLFEIDDKKLIQSAIVGLFDGDGCYRKREYKGGVYYHASLKTTSEKIAYEIVYLLAKHFGVYASIHYGFSKERMFENRTLKESDYFMVDIYGNENLNKLFPNRFNKLEVTRFNRTSNGKFREIKKVENEVLYDITLSSDSSHIFPINGYVLTHNCGGGNPLSHPQLIELLTQLKEQGVISNITVNQNHCWKYMDLMKQLIRDELIFGLGISYNGNNYDFYKIFKKLNFNKNVVLHVINGVVDVVDLKYISRWRNAPKLLILGYKDIRRGSSYLCDNQTKIIQNQQMLKENLKDILKYYPVVSFDNLALEQLDVKSIVPKDEWDNHFQGDDGTHTMYVDLVRQEFAVSSTSETRYNIKDHIDKMFIWVKICANEEKEKAKRWESTVNMYEYMKMKSLNF